MHCTAHGKAHSFCSGQTGSGKTFTMMGAADEAGRLDRHQRGLIPRVLEYLFVSLAKEEKRVIFVFIFHVTLLLHMTCSM